MKTNKKEIKKAAASKEFYYSISTTYGDSGFDVIDDITENSVLDTKENCLSQTFAGDIVYKVTINVEKLGVAKVVIGNE